MPRGSRSVLETLLAEVLMADLAHCDLGDGVEVVHDVESVEIELECALDDDDDDAEGEDRFMEVRAIAALPEPDPADTLVDHPVFDEALLATTQFLRVGEEIGTHQFVRESAPYERIEIQLDPGAFRRATIEDAKRRRVAH